MILLLLWQAAGPATLRAITIGEEEELSKEFMKTTQDQYPFIRDPSIVGYVTSVGEKILKTMPTQPFTYRFFVLRQPVFNAFAGPAAHIFINSGLMAAMESEDELAGILAHEIVHAMARHISQKIDQSSKMNLALIGGLIAGVFLGMAGGGELGSAVATSAMAAGQSASLAYSRQDEMQADELGIQYLCAAGYSGVGLLTVLKKIRDTQLFGSSDIPSYLMTHPAVDDRIAYLDTWLAGHPEYQADRPSSSEAFRHFRTRLIAGYGDKGEALREMTQAFQENPNDPIVQHGYGIALARNDRTVDGAGYVRMALSQKPFDAVMLKDLGEIQFMGGLYDDALDALEASLGINPEDPEALYLAGRACIARERFAEASRFLEKALKRQPQDLSIVWFLGDAQGKAGNMGDAHYWLGLHAYMKHDMRNARFHLAKAAHMLTDPSKKPDIDRMMADMGKWPAPDEETDVLGNKKKQVSAGVMPGQNGKNAW